MSRQQQPETSVVIVNWNGRKWLEQCLPTLREQTYRDFEIVVVDNGSSDGSVEWLAAAWQQAAWPAVRVLALEDNAGFARANNIGIQASSGAYVVTLNNDTRARPDWLSELVKAAAPADVGMAAACILQWDDPGRLDSAGIEVDRAGIAWQRGWDQPAARAAAAADVFGPSAAAALYRRRMLEQIGLFDEDFFAYYEDVDLAWRGQLAGWRCRYTPGAQVLHWHSATAAAQPARKVYLTSRNKIWTMLKNYAPGRWLAAVLLYDALALGYQLTRGERAAAWRGRLDAWRQRRVALAKRPSPLPRAPLAALTPPWRLGGRIRAAGHGRGQAGQ